MSLVVVDMNMTQEDVNFFRYPEEWEAYVIKWDENTIFLDEAGTEITVEKSQQHDYHIKIWTKEAFNKELSKLNTEADGKLVEGYPVYTAQQIQLIEMKVEDYIEKHVTFQEGKIAVNVFLGEEISKDEKLLYSFQKELNEFMSNHSNIQSYRFSFGEGNNRDVQFLEIEDYPAFFVFDHEQLIFKTYEQEKFIEFIENY